MVVKGVFAGGVLFLAVVASALQQELVMGSHSGGADSFALDMNPTLTPANTPTSLGTLQNCARIEPNGVQDADEDVVDAVTLDATITNLPASTAMIGFQYVISYNEAALTVASYENVTLLAANPGAQLFDATTPVPDNDGDGRWAGAMADFSETPPESGTGVLQRITIRTDAGVPPGLYALTFLTDPDTWWSGHADANNDLYLADNYYGGTIAIGTSYCPRRDSDNDLVFDQDEYACAGAAAVYDPTKRPERLDLLGDDDGDTLINEPLPPGSAGFDCDGDGYKGDAVTGTNLSSSEKFVYGTADTSPDQDPCGSAPTVAPFNVPVGWPADLAGGAFSGNRINVSDLAVFQAPVQRTNTSPGDANYNPRWDIVPGTGGLGPNHINAIDLNSVSQVAPAMNEGLRAYGSAPCPWPP
jgi:hypothetical protein